VERGVVDRVGPGDGLGGWRQVLHIRRGQEQIAADAFRHDLVEVVDGCVRHACFVEYVRLQVGRERHLRGAFDRAAEDGEAVRRVLVFRAGLVQQRILLEEGQRVFDREVMLSPGGFSGPLVVPDAGEVPEQ
jgi:hypothetical protein